jgi:hypothetical protein
VHETLKYELKVTSVVGWRFFGNQISLKVKIGSSFIAAGTRIERGYCNPGPEGVECNGVWAEKSLGGPLGTNLPIGFGYRKYTVEKGTRHGHTENQNWDELTLGMYMGRNLLSPWESMVELRRADLPAAEGEIEVAAFQGV